MKLHIFVLTGFVILSSGSCKKEKCKCPFDDWIGTIVAVHLKTSECQGKSGPPGTSWSVKETNVKNRKLITTVIGITDTSRTVYTIDSSDFIPEQLEILLKGEDSIQVGDKTYPVKIDQNTLGGLNLFGTFQYDDFWKISGNQLIHEHKIPLNAGRGYFSKRTVFEKRQ